MVPLNTAAKHSHLRNWRQDTETSTSWAICLMEAEYSRGMGFSHASTPLTFVSGSSACSVILNSFFGNQPRQFFNPQVGEYATSSESNSFTAMSITTTKTNEGMRLQHFREQFSGSSRNRHFQTPCVLQGFNLFLPFAVLVSLTLIFLTVTYWQW